MLAYSLPERRDNVGLEPNRWLVEEGIAKEVGGSLVEWKRYGFAFRLLDWHHPRQTWALFAMPGLNVSWFAERPLNWNTWLDHAPK